ncbi:sensor histidine kinase [Streptococcus loxodontisalivarius]
MFALDFAVRLLFFGQISKEQLSWKFYLISSSLVGLLSLLVGNRILYLEPIFLFLIALYLRPRWRWSQYLFYCLFPFALIDVIQRMTGSWEVKAVIHSFPMESIEQLIFSLISEIELLIFYYLFIKILRVDIANIKRIFNYPEFKGLILLLNASMLFYSLVLHAILVASGDQQELSFTLKLANTEISVDLMLTQVLIFIGSILYFNFKMKEILDKELEESKEQQIRSLSSYSKHVESLYKELRSFRHDYTNVLVSLNQAIQEEDMGQVKSVYETVIAGSDKRFYDSKYDIANLSNLQNDAMKSLISAKLIEAQNRGISLTVEIPELIDAPKIDLLDMVTILSIFLDNAIEAAEEATKPRLTLAYFKEGSARVLIIENSTAKDKIATKDIFKYGQSSKGADRGIGLANVREILGKYPQASLATRSRNYLFSQELKIDD